MTPAAVSSLVIELLILILAVLSWLRGGAKLGARGIRTWHIAALGVGLFFFVASVVSEQAAIAVLKLCSMIIATCYAYGRPRNAIWLLGLSTAASVCFQALSGHVWDKYSSIPFLVFAALWSLSSRAPRRLGFTVFLLAFSFELFQAYIIDSRTNLLIGVGVLFIASLPKKVSRGFVVFVAVSAPVLFPVLLLLVFTSFQNQLGLLEQTASNLQRSSMAAWCLSHFFEFLVIGPGSASFGASIQDIVMALGGYEADSVDPHQFLLTFWVALGAIPVVSIYISWCVAWAKLYGRTLAGALARLSMGVLAVNAIVLFITTAPDARQRTYIGLMSGLAFSPILSARQRSKFRVEKNAHATQANNLRSLYERRYGWHTNPR